MWVQVGSKLTKKAFFIPATYLPTQSSQLFKSLEFGNGSRMFDENLVILEFKYLQNKKW